MYDHKSGRGYLERLGILATLRRPIPRIQPDALTVHGLPLESPQLVTDYVREAFVGDPSPDRGVTQAWPPPAVGTDPES